MVNLYSASNGKLVAKGEVVKAIGAHHTEVKIVESFLQSNMIKVGVSYTWSNNLIR